MENLISEYEIVVGIFLPLLIAVFVKEAWDKKLKVLVSFLFVVAAAIGHAFYSGLWGAGALSGSVLKILVLTVTTYKGFWISTGVTDFIEKKVGATDKSILRSIAFVLPLALLLSFSSGCTYSLRNLDPGATELTEAQESSLSNEEALYYAIRWYRSAWEKYHKVWLALEDEQVKREWVKKYHTKFRDAGQFLDIWALNPTSTADRDKWKMLRSGLEDILIQLVIK